VSKLPRYYGHFAVVGGAALMHHYRELQCKILEQTMTVNKCWVVIKKKIRHPMVIRLVWFLEFILVVLKYNHGFSIFRGKKIK
jgi:hypothetical protein